jgi:hypothetical protein
MKQSSMLMNTTILSYAIIAIAAATAGVTGLMTNGGHLTSTYAQTAPTGGQYCAPGDYKCHEDYAVQDYEAKNYTGSIYHYDLAAGSAPYGPLPMEYEQAADSLKYGNYTDYEDNYKEVQKYGATPPPTPPPTTPPASGSTPPPTTPPASK